MTASLLITLAEWWLYAGAAVAAVFIAIGIDRIDEDARGAYIFRPLLIPAVLLIWPIVLWRWRQLETSGDRWDSRFRPDRRAHGRWWALFGILIPMVFIGAMVLRQTWPVDFEPIRLDAPRDMRP